MSPPTKRFRLSGAQNTDSSRDAKLNPELPVIIRFYDPEIKARDASGRTLDQILAWNDDELEACHDYIQMLFPLPEGSMFNMRASVVTREVVEAFLARPEVRARMQIAWERMMRFYGFNVKYTESQEDRAIEVDNSQGEFVNPQSDSEPRVKDNAPEDDKRRETQNSPTKSSFVKSESHSNAEFPESAAQQSQSTNIQITRASNWSSAFNRWAVRFDHNHLRITRILRSLRLLGLQPECEAFFTTLCETYNDPSLRIGDRSMDYWRKAVEQPLHIAPDGERVPWLRNWCEELDKQGTKGLK